MKAQVQVGCAFCLALFACWLWTSPVVGADKAAEVVTPEVSPESTEDLKIQLYQGPVLKDTVKPRYPARARRHNQEGWVRLNFMVDTEGRPYEISVSDSVGAREFQEAAIKAARQWQFEPANLNGVALDAGYNTKIQFHFEGGANGASRSFLRSYKELAQAINNEQHELATELLANLNPNNLYESAYAYIVRFRYALVWGTETEQLRALRHAIAYESQAKYLPSSLFKMALQQLLYLQLRQAHHAEALATANTLLKQRLKKDVRTEIERVHAKLVAFRDSDQPFARVGTVGNSNSFWLRLWRNKFSVAVESGAVAELKLRCDQGYVFFRYDPQLVYTLPGGNKSCLLEVVGNPGSEIKIAQQ